EDTCDECHRGQADFRRIRSRATTAAATVPQAWSAIFSKAARSKMMIAPSDIWTIRLLCHLLRHLFTLSRVPPTMLANSLWLNRILGVCAGGVPVLTRNIIFASLEGSCSRATSAKIWSVRRRRSHKTVTSLSQADGFCSKNDKTSRRFKIATV